MSWEATTRDVIDFKRIYVDMAGDIIAALVLSDIVYWHLPSNDGASKLRVEKEGRMWIAASMGSWWDRCRITEKQARRAIEILAEKGIILTKVFKFNGAPTTHISIEWKNFMSLWESCLSGANLPPGKLDSPFSEVSSSLEGDSLTETTAETTTLNAIFLETEEDENGELHAKARNAQYKLKLQDAMERGAARNKNPQIANFLNEIPENLRSLAEAFCESFGRPPLGKPEKSFWIKSWQRQKVLGIRPDHVRAGLVKASKEGLTIKSPESVTALAEDIMRKSSEGGSLPGVGEVVYSERAAKLIGWPDFPDQTKKGEIRK